MPTVAVGIPFQVFSLMWSSPDVIGLFSNNVVSFSSNVVLRDHLFSLNSVSKPRMFSIRAVYVLSSLQLSKIPKLLTPADSSVTNVGTMFLASLSEVIAKEEYPTLPGL